MIWLPETCRLADWVCCAMLRVQSSVLVVAVRVGLLCKRAVCMVSVTQAHT